ncbi:MAG: TonB-dependent receptor [Acidobacteria bacterium]|nr:TonB-dependent receptor [Acidobacteriota bacterium]
MHFVKRLAVILSIVLVSAGMMYAQVTTGTIMGTISDSTGAVIPGATVTIRNTETGISRTATTDAAGRYRVPQLGLGNYEITAESAGFQTAVRTGVTLTVGREAVLDFTLQVGAVAERITVTGEAPLIQTTTATVSGLVDERTMRDLPLLGRSYADLTTIQPGVVSDIPISASGFNAVYSGGGGRIRRSIGGTRPQQSTYLLDGVELSTPSEGMPVGSVLGEQLGVDAIREFTLLQNNFGAQFGRAAGGVVNAVTQYGTNEFHGTVFEFFRNEKLDARDHPVQLDSKLPKVPLKRNQFGASLGGPIVKDRAFFFANYEGLRQSSGVARVGATYTADTRLGRITACANPPVCNQARIERTVTVNEDIKHFFKTFPLPNGGYRAGGVADLLSVSRWRGDENYGIGRVDYHLSSNDTLFGRFTKDVSTRSDDMELQVPEGYFGFQEGGYVLGALSYTHIFSPTVLNTASVGFTRRNDHLFYNYSDGGEFFPQGHPNLDPRWSCAKGVPLCLYGIPGLSIYGGPGPQLSGPAVFVDNGFDYSDSLMINKGNHSVVLGGTVKQYQMNHKNEPWVYSGTFSWQNIEDFLANRPLTTTQILGFSTPGSQKGDVYRGWRQTYGAGYVQDDWKVLPNLTLNLGLRWERIQAPSEVNGKLSIIRDVYRDSDLTRLGKGARLFEMRRVLGGFAPRFGFAWTPFANQKTVLRGGFGMFPEMPMAYVWQLALEAYPYSVRYTVPNPKYPYPFADIAAVKSSREPLITGPTLKTPVTYQWTFSMERQLGENWVIKAIYLGNRTANQFAVYNPNAEPAILVNGRPFVEATAKPPNPNFTSYRQVANIIDHWYNAGQLVVEKRMSAGLRFNTSYTWSRNLDTGASGGTKCAETVGGTTSQAIYNNHDPGYDKGFSAFHTKHNFIFSYTWEAPFGTGQRWGSQWPAVVDYILGGWSVNGTNSIRSGLPVNIGMSPRQSRCTAQSCPERPDLKPGGNNNPVLENWTPEQYFDLTQFTVPALGFFGNVGRNTMIRPGVVNMNLSLAKGFRIGETRDLEFRAEFFNFLNHPNFGAPAASIFRNAAGALNANVGRITSTETDMRRIQMGLKFTF